MKYRGYEATIKYDKVDQIFFGKAIDTRDIISFDGESVAELKESFKAVIEEY